MTTDCGITPGMVWYVFLSRVRDGESTWWYKSVVGHKSVVKLTSNNENEKQG